MRSSSAVDRAVRANRGVNIALPELCITRGARDPVPPLLAGGVGVTAWRDLHEVTVAWGFADEHRQWVFFPQIGLYEAGEGRQSIRVTVFLAAPDTMVVDTYYRSVVPLFLQAWGFQSLHASAVRMGDGIVAFTGRSGSGKSTLAYGLSQRGYPQWADDAVILQCLRHGVESLAAPFAVRLLEDASDVFGRMGSGDGLQQSPLSDPLPLRAILVISSASSESQQAVAEIYTLHGVDAFEQVLAGAYCMSLHEQTRRDALVRDYLRIAASTPVLALAVPPTLDRLDETLDLVESALAAL